MVASCLSSTLLRCLGGAKSSFDFRRLSFRIIRAAANAMLMYFLFLSLLKTKFSFIKFSPKKLLFRMAASRYFYGRIA